MSAKPRKVYPKTFLPHNTLLFWAARLVEFVQADSPAAVARRWEKEFQEEARVSGDPMRAIRDAPQERYAPLQQSLHAYLSELDQFLDGLGRPINRQKWAGLVNRKEGRTETLRRKLDVAIGRSAEHSERRPILRRPGELSVERHPRVTVSGVFAFDGYGQQFLLSPHFDWLPLAFTVTAADLLNPAATVLIRRCECELYKDVGGCGLFLVQDYAPGRGGDKLRCVPAHKLKQKERNKLLGCKTAQQRASVLRSYREARKKL